MGYVRKKKTFVLKFDDEDMEGLVVKATTVSTEQLLDLEGNLSQIKKVDKERVKEILQGFAEVLVSWNLEEEDGTPVPCSVAGLMSQDIEFVLAVLYGWVEGVSSVNSPLAKKSSNGVKPPTEDPMQDLMASIPMEVLQPSLGN